MSQRESLSVNALAAVLALDAVYNVVPNRWIDEDLERLRVPRWLRFALASAKGSGAVALMLRRRRPGLARLASACLTLYFLLAIGAHVRVRDEAWRCGSAAVLLGWSGVTWSRLSRDSSKPAVLDRPGAHRTRHADLPRTRLRKIGYVMQNGIPHVSEGAIEEHRTTTS